MQDYIKPGSIAEAVAALRTPGAMLLCGGTDLLVKRRLGIVEPKLFVDISDLAPLRVLREADGEVEIGAAVPITEIIASPLVHEKLPLLPWVLGKLGSLQIRNRASLGGNLVNASPAADSAIPLLLYEAQLALVSASRARNVPVEGFFRGPGKTVLQPGELIRAVRIPVPTAEFATFFHKVGRRKALTIAIASLGCLARVSAGKIAEIRIAAGSVAPTPIRLRRTEALLTGAELSAETIEQARDSARDEVSPIDDIQGSAAYRRAVIGDLLTRFLEGLG